IGQGNQAVGYCSQSKTCHKLPLGLRQGKVHGFASTSGGLVLAYSENEYSLYRFSPSKDGEPFEMLYEGETKDWINAAMFLGDNQTTDKQKFVLHMSHSALLHMEYDVVLNECCALELARCTDSSILYYTRLHGLSYDDLVVISGNAFGELLVWEPRIVLDDAAQNSVIKTYPLLLRIPAHNGVIHSIDFDLDSQILITTSDDRSVKFWRIQKQDQWRNAEIKPIISCFGHSSRVMCAILVRIGKICAANKNILTKSFHNAGKGEFVVSGGEDSYVCIWSRAGDLLMKRRQHFGAPIWRLGFNRDTSTLYSTSSTGNLVAQNLKEVLRSPKALALQLSALGETNEYVRKLKFVNNTTIVGLSSSNRMFYMEMAPDLPHKQKWLSVNDFPSYKRTVLEAFDNVIATGGHRRITLHSYNPQTYRFSQIFDGERLPETIRSFHFLSQHHYLVSDVLGNCVLLKGSDLSLDANISLRYPNVPWLTAALLITEEYLLLGDRKGHVMLYHRSSEKSFEWKDTLSYVGTKIGANFFKLLSLTADDALVLSGAHEPVLKYLHIDLKDRTIRVRQRENIPLAWVEAFSGKDLILGFNDNHIVAWSRQYDVLMQLACGGGHRCWDYCLNRDELCLIYVKQKNVFFHRNSLYTNAAYRIANVKANSWHTRNCNTMRLLARKNSPRTTLIVSAGDDNLIKVTTLVDDAIIQSAELHSHISSVRCLQAYPHKSEVDSNSWFIFSVGGRSQLCISQLNISRPLDECHVHELCTQTLQNEVAAKSNAVEARLMAIEIAQGSVEECFSLYVAGADGKVCYYLWHSEKPSQLELQNSADIQRCPLKLQWIRDQCILLITTTNGEMFAFDQGLTTKFMQLQLHATGINAIDIYVHGQLMHVVSGGDDENIKYTVINLRHFTVEHETGFSGLHNAQVNALSLHCEKSQLFAYTCSIDKQIFRIDLRTREYSRVGFTCLADIKGLLIDEHRRMYCYGEGLQVIS
ncbi:hypothetical protein KR009_001064, partial [Drosophila setifemur]